MGSNTISNNLRLTWYKKKLAEYGILSMLYVLEEFEKKQMFEECAKIKQAIEEHAKFLEKKAYTRVCKKIINETSMLLPSWSKREVKKRYKEYAKEIINDYFYLREIKKHY